MVSPESVFYPIFPSHLGLWRLTLPASQSTQIICFSHHLNCFLRGKHKHPPTGLVAGLVSDELGSKGRGKSHSPSTQYRSSVLPSEFPESNEALCQLAFKTVRRSSGSADTRSESLISSLSLVESASTGSASTGA